MDKNDMDSEDRDETKDGWSEEEAAYGRFKFLIEKAIHDLTNADAVDLGCINQQVRSFKAKLIHVVDNWPKYEMVTEPWPELIEIVKEIKEIKNKINEAYAVVYADQSCKAGEVFNYDLFGDSTEFVRAENWSSKITTQRRKSQIESNLLPETAVTTNFKTETPQFYACDKCISNDHSYKDCTRSRTCLRCAREGHMAFECKYNLCVYCQLYGHGQIKCPRLKAGEPPECHRCGGTSHFAANCRNPFARYCRLCGGAHNMTQCNDFDGDCYRHCGRHLYDDCPDKKR